MAIKKPFAHIAALKPKPSRHRRELMTDEEAAEVIKAIRRGVTTVAINDAIGSARGSVYTRLGRWCMHRCRCFGKAQ